MVYSLTYRVAVHTTIPFSNSLASPSIFSITFFPSPFIPSLPFTDSEDYLLANEFGKLISGLHFLSCNDEAQALALGQKNVLLTISSILPSTSSSFHSYPSVFHRGVDSEDLMPCRWPSGNLLVCQSDHWQAQHEIGLWDCQKVWCCPQKYFCVQNHELKNHCDLKKIFTYTSREININNLAQC